MNPTPRAILAELWREVGGDDAALGHVELNGHEPVLPSSFRVDVAAQATIAASALAAAEIHHLRGHPRQRASVNLRHAAAEFRSERLLRIDGRPAPAPWDRIAGIYRCAGGAWLRLHTNFAHHRDGVLALLRCAHDRSQVAAALARVAAPGFEDEASAAGLAVAMLRSLAEWDAHAQAQAVALRPLVAISRIGDAPPRSLPPRAGRPLAGVRVLDLTRIIAGPVCGRALAAHGAEVLLITAPHLPSIVPLVVDTGRGKRSAALDLRDPRGHETLRRLIGEADIFIQGYRPGALAALGFAPERLAGLRPGIVCVSLSAYGESGPWGGRRGFDSLVQTASGINYAEMVAAGASEPRALPCQALDHASGYLMALGALAALARRIRDGGSWHVEVSLARTALWLRGLGRIDGSHAPDPPAEAFADLLEPSASGFGWLDAVRHAGRLDATPPAWSLPSVPLGTHPTAWA